MTSPPSIGHVVASTLVSSWPPLETRPTSQKMTLSPQWPNWSYHCAREIKKKKNKCLLVELGRWMAENELHLIIWSSYELGNCRHPLLINEASSLPNEAFLTFGGHQFRIDEVNHLHHLVTSQSWSPLVLKPLYDWIDYSNRFPFIRRCS